MNFSSGGQGDAFGPQKSNQGQNVQGTPFPFDGVTGREYAMEKNGVLNDIKTRYSCITVMPAYQDQSLEELRLGDYQLNRNGPQATIQYGAPTILGASQVAALPTFFGGQAGSGSPFGQLGGMSSTAKSVAPVFGFGVSNAGQTSTFGGRMQTPPSNDGGTPVASYVFLSLFKQSSQPNISQTQQAAPTAAAASFNFGGSSASIPSAFYANRVGTSSSIGSFGSSSNSPPGSNTTIFGQPRQPPNPPPQPQIIPGVGNSQTIVFPRPVTSVTFSYADGGGIPSGAIPPPTIQVAPTYPTTPQQPGIFGQGQASGFIFGPSNNQHPPPGNGAPGFNFGSFGGPSGFPF